MAESSQQPATETNHTLLSSWHIQRLEHRRTEPSGIVDVRPLQSHFTRVPRWIVQRAAVLDGIIKRYGTQNNTLAQEADLVLVAPSQAVPTDETSTFETATPTATSSSIPIAPASRSELTTQRSSSSTSSTPQQFPKQGESQPQLPLIANNSPAAPTLQRTASPSPPHKLTNSQTPSSPPPPSGQFRVSRKAIPLPKVQADTASQTESSLLFPTKTLANPMLVSAKKNLGEGKSETSDEEASVSQPSIFQATLAKEVPIPPEISAATPSLILPKHLQQESLSTFGNNQNSIQTDISQPSIFQATLAKEVPIPPEISAATPSLVLPKHLQQESLSTFGNNQNSIQTDISQPSIFQATLAKEVPIPPEISAATPSLILPKHLQQESLSTFGNNQNSIQTDISQPSIFQATLAKEVPIPPEISAATPSLILPKRLQQESLSTFGSTHAILEQNIKQQSKRSFSRENSTPQNLAQIPTHNTQNQLPTVGEIVSTLYEFPQPEQSLILPKRLSEASAKNAQSSGFSGNLPTSTLQRKVEHENPSKTPAVAIASSAEPLRAIASEIPSPDNVLEPQNMVWRKSMSKTSSENLFSLVSNGNHQTGMPLAINLVRGEQYIARQISNTSTSNSNATAQINNSKHTITPTTAAQTNTQTHEISVAQIAEQVSRILERNLSIERERRGMNLWY